MNSEQIRTKFFDFFIKQDHEHIASSSLIPAHDPTLLFANAGMNQFKDVFLGKEKRPYTRAVSIQKCVRAGGKHNDLDNVGFTKRHLTFFEMMGNFSFGDYFKKEAIIYAWKFLTQELQLSQEKLYASVFINDDQAYDIWCTLLPKDRIVRLGEADNFWQMGDTGPCGPCSEIYIDRGSEQGCKKPTCGPGCLCDRFLEIWNLVFMQFDRQADGTDKPLAQTGVDTGMGLERLCLVVQNKDSVFRTDLFEPLITTIEELTGLTYTQQDKNIQAAFHVLVDHIRSSALIIADGATPSNEGRGYVLRKIIRRAALFQQKLTNKNIFSCLVDPLAQKFEAIYPELMINREKVKTMLNGELEKFTTNLVRGQALLEEYLQKQTHKVITGHEAFKLYDTYGFPLELIKVLAHERGFSLNLEGFNKEMDKQREQSGKKQHHELGVTFPETISTIFTGYEEHLTIAPIVALIYETQLVDHVTKGQECWVITERSPFYVECGGQISDQGWIMVDGKKIQVHGLAKFNNAIGAKIIAPHELTPGQTIEQCVDSQIRFNTMKNHTATHLLQAALINLLGPQIKQSGSLVTPDYLRFDFTYHENLSPAQIKQVEDQVNHVIMANISLTITHTTYQNAVSQGVIAFFGEKYNPSQVRVVNVPGVSAELCGGTHVQATGDIGCFKITEVSALSAGNRRLVAVTGPKAVELFQDTFSLSKELCHEFRVQQHEILTALHKQKESLKEAQTERRHLKKELSLLRIPGWIEKTELLGTLAFLFLDLPEHSIEELRDIAQRLNKAKPGLYFLISPTSKNVTFLVTVDPSLAAHLNLNELKVWLATTFDLHGGGSPTTIQGGGAQFKHVWVEQIKSWIKKQFKTQGAGPYLTP
jgi:alanyl-tRNA synthetase